MKLSRTQSKRRHLSRYAVAILLLSFFFANTNTAFSRDDFSVIMGNHLVQVSTWTQKDGLPHWHYQDIKEDSKGFLWILLPKQLVRFDGKQFQSYAPPSTDTTLIRFTSLVVDQNDHIWIHGLAYGQKVILKIFDPQQEQFIDPEQYLGSPLPELLPPDNTDDRFFSLLKLGSSVYLSSMAGKMWRYDGQWQQILDLPADMLPERYYYYFPADNRNYWKIPRKGDFIELINQSNYPIHTYQVTNFFVSNIWIDSQENLWSYNGFTKEYQQYLPDGTSRSYPADLLPPNNWKGFHKWSSVTFPNPAGYTLSWNSGQLGLGYRGKTLHNKLHTLILENAAIAPSEEWHLFLKSDGSFWSRGIGGLVRIQITQQPFTSSLSSEKDRISVRAIGAWNDSLLLVNTYAGSFFIHKENLQTSPANLPVGRPQVGYAIQTRGQNIWFGSSYRPVYVYNPTEQSYTYFSSQEDHKNLYTYDFHFPRSGAPLIATQRGLYQVDTTKNEYARLRFLDTAIYVMQERAGQLYLGTDFGVYHWQQKRFVLQKDQLGQILKVYHVLMQADSSLWLATNRGLVHWNPDTQETVFFNEDTGYPIPLIHAVYQDHNGRLWLPGNEGLFLFSPEDRTLRIFSEEDGLPTNEFNALAHYQAEDGRLYFGSINGLISFSPEAIPSQPSARAHFPAFLTHISYYQKGDIEAIDKTSSTKVSGTINIPRSANFLSIRFSIPYFQKSPLFTYWRIPGVFENWTLLEKSEINIPVPDHGKHSLELMTQTFEEPLNTQTQKLIELDIARPLYLRTDFWILVSLLALILAASLSRIYNIYLRQWNQRLKQIVREKTAELQAKTQELQELNTQKSQLFSNLIHEFRTPLTIISGHGQDLLKTTQLNSHNQQKTAQLLRNAAQIERITNEIQDLSRIDKGIIQVERDRIKWPNLIEEIVDSLKLYADRKNQQLGLDSSSSPFYFQSDRSKLQRILNNLITNALKYTQNGGQIKVTEVQSDQQLTITVEDNGPGIAPEDQERVFQRFFQVKQSDQRSNASGMGIGLSICKEYTKLLGGSLTLESKVEQGTRFTLQIPIRPLPIAEFVSADSQAAIAASSKLEPLSTAKPSQIAKEGPAILLAEDNFEMQEYISSIVSPHYSLYTVNNGQEALDFLRKQTRPIELIISDIRMPSKDGLELLKEVRQDKHQRLANIPFLLVTTFTDTILQTQAFRLGVDGFIAKPFVPEELLARIERQLSRFIQRKKQQARLIEPQQKQSSSAATLEHLSYDEKWMEKFREVLNEHLRDPGLKISDLAAELFLSERSLRDKVKAYTGLSPSRLLMLERLNLALKLLKEKKYKTISEVCYEVGIRNPSHFSRVFKKEFGKSPTAYINEEQD